MVFILGEYLLYYNDIYFGGICDNTLMVKKVLGNEKYKLDSQIPYEGAKPMYVIEASSRNGKRYYY